MVPPNAFSEVTPQTLTLETAQPGPWMVDGDIYADASRVTVSAGPRVELLVGGTTLNEGT